MANAAKKTLKAFLIVLATIIIIAVLFILWLTMTEYNPPDLESVEVQSTAPGKTVALGDEIGIISWNIGYAALGENSDFVLDGGGNAPHADKETVVTNLSEIASTLGAEKDVSLYMLQEVDTDSDRSYSVDERNYLGLAQDAHALNYSCKFVPFPWPPFGKVNSGLFTASNYDIQSADRISLPCPFSWPLRTANLKRCLLASYLPIEGSDKKLVIVNLHLEAYDDGEGKIAQTNKLKSFIQSEYEKGNYVIAGGDFNQYFPGSLNLYPNTHTGLWAPGMLTDDSIPKGFSFAYDTSVPSCRLLNQPYDPTDTENTQYYLIDGFIVSPNVQLISVNTMNKGFENTDHNPVKLVVSLQ